MNNQFYKGRANNHLTWMAVDSTDFATPESALSAAQKIVIYGKLRGGTGVNFVSSGTGSMAGGDIVHVGPSALGIYTVPLVKADLSDASAAWYDHYIIAITAAGMAQQTLIVDGGIDLSAMSAYQSRLSDLASYLVALSGVVSDAHSAAAQANSRVLVVQSHASQIDSVLSSLNSEFLSRVPKIVASQSLLSDVHSDLKSAIGAVSVTLTASDISDIASQVAAAVAISGPVSDIYSLLSSLNSEFLSRVPKAVATNSQLSDLHSDLRSYLVVMSGVLSQVDSVLSNVNSVAGSSPTASQIASAVIVELGGDMSDIRSAITAAGGSASEISDLYSLLSSLNSEFLSRVPKAVATQSQLSDLHSDLRSYLVVMSGVLSDVRSNLSDLDSNFQSRVPKLVATNSQLSDLHSDLKSALGAVSVTIDASAISDLASQIIAALPGAATASDIASVVWTNTPGAAAASRILQMRNLLSDLDSNFQSRVPKEVAARSQLSDLHSDLKSHLQVSSGVLSDLYSLVQAGVGVDASDIASVILAAAAANPIHANVKEVNDVQLTGDGSATPWGPA